MRAGATTPADGPVADLNFGVSATVFAAGHRANVPGASAIASQR